ncbi:MAG: hypothetical protein R2800_03280 [Flavipsychrobacter sp.]
MDTEKEKYLITKQIERLVEVCSRCIKNKQNVEKFKEKISSVSKANPDLEAKRQDSNSIITYFGYLFAVTGAVTVDIFLLKTALMLICLRLALPLFFTYILPPILVTIELTISYIVNRRIRSREGGSSFEKSTPYLVLLVIIGLVTVGIRHKVVTDIAYDEAEPLFQAIFDYALSDVVFFIFSLVAHLIIILYADSIMTAFSFFRHKFLINEWNRKIERLNNYYIKQLTPSFAKEILEYLHIKKEFVLKFPNKSIDYDDYIPEDVKRLACDVLGRSAFELSQNNKENNNTSYEKYAKSDFVPHGEA